VRGKMSGGAVVGGSHNFAIEAVGRLADLALPGRIGNNLEIEDGVHWFDDRAAAGLPTFPRLPIRQ